MENMKSCLRTLKQKTTMALMLIVTLFSSILNPTKAFLFSFARQPEGLPYELVSEMARSRYSTPKENDPLYNRVVVITGAAGGIGRAITTIVYQLGAVVIAMDKNSEGLEMLKNTLVKNGNSERIITLPTNHEDLNSVSKSAKFILDTQPKIDLLINNAGLAYTQDKPPGVSSHSKDLAFTVNYLSHFLLTKILLPTINESDGRVVQVTSSFHWKVDGSEITPKKEKGSWIEPLAYEGLLHKQSPEHVGRSYANTKLAQIWHSRVLLRLYNEDRKKKKTQRRGCYCISSCPTWASTDIAGKEATLLQKLAFPVMQSQNSFDAKNMKITKDESELIPLSPGPGITSVLNAMFKKEEDLGNGDLMVANSRILEKLPLERMLNSEVMSKIEWRDVVTDFCALILLLGQRFTHEKFILQRTSPESYDIGSMEALFQWSEEEVAPWVP